MNTIRLIKGGLAIAALCLPLAAQAATQTYVINNTAQLVGMGFSCATDSWYNGCSTTQPGFVWTDTIAAGSTISAVQIRFNDGVDCHGTGTVLTTSLNGTAGPNYSTPFNDCWCAPTPKIITMNLPVGAYTRGGTNTFLTTNPGTCLGSALTAIGATTAYAVIDVTYTAGTGGGGGGSCDLTPIEAKLDDSTRFTSDVERNNLLNGIVSEINQNEFKIDNLTNAVAALETKADSQVSQINQLSQSDMERALGEDTNVNKPMAIYMLPSANGGMLEAVRALVAQTIANASAAGCSTAGAPASLASGDAAYAGAQWDEAYVAYSQAYKQASAGPCN